MGKKQTTAHRAAAATITQSLLTTSPGTTLNTADASTVTPAARHLQAVSPAPMQPPRDLHEVSSCLAARTSTLALYTHTPASSDPFVTV
ncbi:hypothetical protein EWM64_g10939 [Hericium alpestre]|uniref:Uncharacterized protein n=1 Tax=Hericium alpestre TaxID=135208 RepID=A0A4Y9ZGW9_9AGAM|nr:hypothetical protein EWM64_g10939 [Hericium alpestre]